MTNTRTHLLEAVAMFEGLFQPLHLLLCFLFGAGVILLAVFLVVLLSRKRGRHEDRISALEEENDRLREEIEKLKKRG
jgi:cell division protein FtsB